MKYIVRKTGFINWLKWCFNPTDNMFIVDTYEDYYELGEIVTDYTNTFKIIFKIK